LLPLSFFSLSFFRFYIPHIHYFNMVSEPLSCGLKIIFSFFVYCSIYLIFLFPKKKKKKKKKKNCGQSPSTPPHCTSTHMLESPSLLTVTVAVPLSAGILAPAPTP
jgi:hypothetical protein